MEPWSSILTGLTVLVAWFSLHRRMNGSGTIAQKTDVQRLNDNILLLCEKIEWLTERVTRLEQRSG